MSTLVQERDYRDYPYVFLKTTRVSVHLLALLNPNTHQTWMHTSQPVKKGESGWVPYGETYWTTEWSENVRDFRVCGVVWCGVKRW